MIIKLVVRTNKLEDNKKPLRERTGEFIIWDNCDMVRFASNGTNIPVDKKDFILATMHNERSHDFKHKTTQYFDGNRKIERTWKMLKNPSVCAEDEQYHYNIVEWRDRLTDKWYRLIYDTFLFICDDKGATIEKVPG